MNETTKKWEFRELCSEDMFPMFNIINKIGFKEFKNCFQSDEVKAIALSKKKRTEDAIKSLGFGIIIDVAGVIIGNISCCENDLFKLFANTSNLSEKEIRELKMAEFAEMIIDFVKKPDFSDFFKVVSGLFK